MQSLGELAGLPAEGIDNVVFYEVYIPDTSGLLSDLEAVAAQCTACVLQHVRKYVWQRERFYLVSSAERPPPWRTQQLKRQRRAEQQQRSGPGGNTAAAAAAGGGQGEAVGPDPPPCLWGAVQFGDCLEDEWFVTWLLLDLTRQLPCTARVWDNDGEFLLIEAAHALPRWADPETCVNRVWLHGGRLHLIPLPGGKASKRRAKQQQQEQGAQQQQQSLLAAQLSVAQALAAVRGVEVDTAAGARIEDALEARMGGYPARAAAQMHVAHALLPCRVAALLREEPQLVAPIVEAFYYRDADGMRAVLRALGGGHGAQQQQQQQGQGQQVQGHMSGSGLQESMCLAAVTLSRTLYAQLALQPFDAPKGYPMPPASSPQHRPALLGLKLAAGLEILLSTGTAHSPTDAASDLAGAPQPQPRQADGGGGDVLREVERSPGWAAFVSALDRRGYFQGHLPGSAPYTSLLRQAAESYRDGESYRRGTAELAARPAERARELLRRLGPPDVGLMSEAPLPPEHSDAWLSNGHEELQRELDRRQQEMDGAAAATAGRRRQQQATAKPPSSSSPFPGAPSPPSASTGAGPGQPPPQEPGYDDAAEISARMEAFVERLSGLEGAEAGPPEAEVGLELDAFVREMAAALGMEPHLPPQQQQRGRGGGVGTGPGAGGGGGNDSQEDSEEDSEEGSSFYSEEGDDEDEEEGDGGNGGLRGWRPPFAHVAPTVAAGRQRGGGAGGGGDGSEDEGSGPDWDARTATDSDDDDGEPRAASDGEPRAASAASGAPGGGPGFIGQYMSELDQQLGASKMGRSFVRASATTVPAAGTGPTTAGGRSSGSAGGGGGGAATRGGGGAAGPAGPAVVEGEGEEEEGLGPLSPVDMDLNLVQSLVESFGMQQGLPGPAGNLAGVMGLVLPRAEDLRGGGGQQGGAGTRVGRAPQGHGDGGDGEEEVGEWAGGVESERTASGRQRQPRRPPPSSLMELD